MPQSDPPLSARISNLRLIASLCLARHHLALVLLRFVSVGVLEPLKEAKVGNSAEDVGIGMGRSGENMVYGAEKEH